MLGTLVLQSEKRTLSEAHAATLLQRLSGVVCVPHRFERASSPKPAQRHVCDGIVSITSFKESAMPRRTRCLLIERFELRQQRLARCKAKPWPYLYPITANGPNAFTLPRLNLTYLTRLI
jgi:hypothetical protein